MSQKESYYKILGTTANIGNARIKEKYIAALKKHPPETDPEGFEKVREAYETLRDPEKRKQYDMMRKFGTNVEGLFEDAMEATFTGNYKKAKKILEQANSMKPNDLYVLIAFMTIAIQEKELENAEEFFDRALSVLPENETEEIIHLYQLKASLLIENDFLDNALLTLEKAIDHLPDQKDKFISAMVVCYMKDGQEEKAWEIMNEVIPSPENETIEDLSYYTSLAELMVELEKWQDKSKVQSHILNFLKRLSEEERDYAFDELFENYDDYYDDGRYREAEFFIGLAKSLDKQNPEIKALEKEVKHLARVQKDIERLGANLDAFPLLFRQAFEWFYKDTMPSVHYNAFLDSMPQDIIAELEEEKELYAAEIIRMKKRYPAVYKHFKEDWDRKFDELTEGFNREMKRELRKIR